MQTKHNTSRSADILLVDDDEIDAMLAQECFLNTSHSINLHRVNNGQMCLDFLRKKNHYADAPTPDLIVLDLHMPVMGGQEVLAEMHQDQQLSKLPVVVMSHSKDLQDIQKLYQHGCLYYAFKSMYFNELYKVVQYICDNFLTLTGTMQKVIPIRPD